MLDHGIRHVPVVSARGRGARRDQRRRPARRRDPHPVRAAQAIADARDVDELRRAARRLNPTLIGLHQADLAPAQISAVISVVGRCADPPHDRARPRSPSGPPPAEFAWLSLGSHGRREAVPSSDIDSGIVWAGEGASDQSATCTRSPTEVLETLSSDGLEVRRPWGDRRPGRSSPTRRPSGSGRSRRWLDHPGRRQGDDGALDRARQPRGLRAPPTPSGRWRRCKAARQRPRVLRLLLRLALADKPPTGFLKDIVVEHSGEHRGTSTSSGAGSYRSWTSPATPGSPPGPPRRRRGSAYGPRRRGTLPRADARTLEEAFDLFAALRLEHQVRQLDAGSEARRPPRSEGARSAHAPLPAGRLPRRRVGAEDAGGGRSSTVRSPSPSVGLYAGAALRHPGARPILRGRPGDDRARPVDRRDHLLAALQIAGGRMRRRDSLPVGPPPPDARRRDDPDPRAEGACDLADAPPLSETLDGLLRRSPGGCWCPRGRRWSGASSRPRSPSTA